MRNVLTFVALVVSLAVVALAACGGGDEGDRAEAEALLRAAALRLEDLPEGLTLGHEEFSTNQESAGEGNDSAGAPTLQELDRWGRVLGYFAFFYGERLFDYSPTGANNLLVDVELFRDASGAHEYLEFNRQRLPEYLQETYGGSVLTIRDLKVSPMAVAIVGDERVGIELKGTAGVPELDTEVRIVTQVVVIRNGRLVALASMTSDGSSQSTQEFEHLIRTLDQRMKDVLAGTTTAVPTATAQATPTSASPTPTAGATVGDAAEAEALLKSMVLREEDLPEGFLLVTGMFTTNEELIDVAGDAGRTTLEDLSRWGRILGHGAVYYDLSATATGTALILRAGTDVYQDATGAQEYLKSILALVSSPEYPTFMEQSEETAEIDIWDVDVSLMPFAEVGDERMAYQVSYKSLNRQLDKRSDFIAQTVYVRRGRVIGSIMVLSGGSPWPVQELEDLARTLDERMKDALD